MLNAKSVAASIINTLNPEWVEQFGTTEQVKQELVEILDQFHSLKELKEADEDEFFIREIDGALCSFKKIILHAYYVK